MLLPLSDVGRQGWGTLGPILLLLLLSNLGGPPGRGRGLLHIRMTALSRTEDVRKESLPESHV